jgi:hypothetical protein
MWTGSGPRSCCSPDTPAAERVSAAPTGRQADLCYLSSVPWRYQNLSQSPALGRFSSNKSGPAPCTSINLKRLSYRGILPGGALFKA